ncbi:hypothetical protein IAU59_002008 [Kwoniella sp. CBS 9459]
MSEYEGRGPEQNGHATSGGEGTESLKIEVKEEKQTLAADGSGSKPDLNSLFSPTSPKREPVDIKEQLEPIDMGAGQPIASSSSNPASASASVIGEEDLNTRTHTHIHAHTRDSTPSSSATPGGKRGRKSAKPTPTPTGPQLIDDLPEAWDEAHETFEALEKCHYELKSLGLSKEQDEMMVCDCVWDRNDPDADPCGPESDCINRALFIECLAGECRAGKHCRNQQFSKRQYANVQVVLTEKKGFGLRAGSSIPANTLIYEYIGEVVAERTFRKRMQQYADEGIKHFYFMMLQKEEYIDATKKGGIGRFANHSCDPNSEVQKWVVGRRLRMGIFTKRDVVKGEEITFNYNVDRYGHDAQICYCGEPNCVGTIGGKTQTDVGTMNDLFLDALGISDEVEAQGMKGSKKKKSRQLDEDFVPILRPIVEVEVQKVSAAIRQSMENKTMMSRLLQRIKMTEEPMIQRQLLRMHGFSLMSMVLTELADDREIVLLALESMSKWKLQIRNKIEDSKVEQPVKALQDSEDEEVSRLAKQLLEYWSTLELSYKIPRVSKIASLDAEDEADTTTIAEADSASASSAARRHDAWENNVQIQFEVAPVRPRMPIPSFSRPRPPPPPPPPAARPTMSAAASSDRLKLDAIIAMAQQPLQSPSLPAPSQSPAAESSRSGSRYDDEEDRRKRQKRSHGYGSSEALDEEKKEKRLTKLVGEVVVRSMSKYKEQMEHDTFKRYARECTTILVEKEKKGHTYSTTRVPTLSEEKKAKMKAFTKEFAHKVLKRLKEKGKLIRTGTGAERGSTSQSARSNSHSTSTLSRLSHEADVSGSQGLTTPTPSGTVIETPRDGDDKDGDLVDDIFGKDDDDDMDMDMEMDVDDGLSQSSISAKSLSAQRNGVSHSHSHTSPLGVGARVGSSPLSAPVGDIKSAPVTVKKMNGGYTVERLDLSLLGKVNGSGGNKVQNPANGGQAHGTQEGMPSDGLDTPRTRTSTYSDTNLSPEQ